MEGSPIAIALWAAGKAPEKLTACSQRFLEGKIKKTTFQALKSCFLKFASWKVLPLQSPEKLIACSQGCLDGGENQKNNFSGSEKLFFEICQLEGSPIAIALWAAGKAPEKLTACSQRFLEGKIKKTTFQALKSCFLKFASWKVLPLQLRFGKLEKHLKSSLPALKEGENQKKQLFRL